MKKRIFVEYLEELVLENICTDDEYGLYLDYKEHGGKVFKDPSNSLLCKKIIKKYNKTYNLEG